MAWAISICLGLPIPSPAAIFSQGARRLESLGDGAGPIEAAAAATCHGDLGVGWGYFGDIVDIDGMFFDMFFTSLHYVRCYFTCFPFFFSSVLSVLSSLFSFTCSPGFLPLINSLLVSP